tara:strand:- start:927 stop:4478 length:3552 start_codon:yes stop_codon:yes gene_type:complete
MVKVNAQEAVLQPEYTTNILPKITGLPNDRESNFADLTRASIGYTYDPIYESAKNAIKYFDKVDPTYKSTEDMEGYEQFQDTLVVAKNAEHMADLKRGIRESKRRREIMGEHGFIANVGAGLFDPVNLLSLPFGGFGLGRSVLQSTARVAAGVGVLQAGQEAIKYPFDPLATKEESLINIGTAVFTGGVLGTLGGVALNRKAKIQKKTAEDMQSTLDSLATLTRGEAASIGDKASRGELGEVADEILESLIVSEPKKANALKKEIDSMSSIAKKTTKQLEQLQQMKVGLARIDADVANLKKESAIRRIEGSRADIDDPNRIANTWFTDSFLYKSIPTAMKNTLQSKIVPTVTKSRFLGLAGDSGTLTAGNIHGTINGNSVHQYSAIRNGEWVQIMDKLIVNFANDKNIKTKVILDMDLNNIDGSFDLYLKDINKKYINNTKPINDSEKEAIELFSNFWTEWEGRLKSVGLIGNETYFKTRLISQERMLKNSQKILDDLNSQNTLSEPQFAYKKSLEKRIPRIQDEINELQLNQKVAQEEGVMPTNEDVMFSRYWNIVNIVENRESFFRILYNWYSDNNKIWVENPSKKAGSPRWIEEELSLNPDDLTDRVNQTIDNIINEPDPASEAVSYFGNGKSKHFRHRALNIPNKLVLDFIVSDPIAVMKAYTQRVAPRYEFAKMNNGKSLDDILDDIDDEMYASGASTKQINKVRKDYIVLYDRVVGTVLRDADSWNARTAAVLRDGAGTNFLGSAGLATLPDISKIIMEHDGEFLVKALKSFRDNDIRMNAEEGRLAAATIDMLLGSSHLRQIEDLSSNPFSNNSFDKYYTKNADKVKNGFYTANLLGPLTTLFKQMDSIVRVHTLIDLSLKRANGTISPKDLAYISRYNIDLAKAKQIKELVNLGIIQKSGREELFLGNTKNWPSKYKDLRDDFRASLNSGIENTILFSSPVDKPTLVDGIFHVPMSLVKKLGAEKFFPEDEVVRGYHRIENPLLGLPFQFMNYGFSALNKITVAFTQNQAKNRALAISTSLGLGYMSLYLKSRTSESGKRSWDNMSWADRFARSFDQSGLLALGSDAFYTAIATSKAFGGPDLGGGIINPKFQGEETKTEAIVGLTGAGPSWGYDIAVNGVGNLLQGNYGEGAKTIVRRLPTANLLWWKNWVNESTADMGNAINDLNGFGSRTRF